MAAPLSTTLLFAKFMGRERATPLAGPALHYHKRTAEGCELQPEQRRGGREGGGKVDLIWRRKHSDALFMSGANTDTSFCISKVDAMQMQTAIYVTHLSSLNVERDWLKSTKTGVRKAFNLSFRLHFQCLLIARLEINTCNEVQSGLQVSLLHTRL